MRLSKMMKKSDFFTCTKKKNTHIEKKGNYYYEQSYRN